MDKLSPEMRSENMRRIRAKDTEPEMMVRRLIHGMGFRYRLHKRDLPGKPDIVFTKKKKAVFVHGCFWHRHDSVRCKISRMPKSNKSYWKNKLAHNKERDEKNLVELKKTGWKTLVVWECQAKKSPALGKKITEFLRKK